MICKTALVFLVLFKQAEISIGEKKRNLYACYLNKKMKLCNI